LRPAGPAGRCQQRGSHPAACTVPVLVSSPAVLAAWRCWPAQHPVVASAPGTFQYARSSDYTTAQIP